MTDNSKKRKRTLVNYLLISFLAFVALVLFVKNSAEAALVAPDYRYEQLNIILLGDSYSAGNGAGNYIDNNDCYRSSANWASNYVKYLNSKKVPVNFQNIACSGAKTIDIYEKQNKSKVGVQNYLLSGNLYKKYDLIRQKLGDKNSVCHYYPDRIVNGYTIRKSTYQNSRNMTSVTVDCHYALKSQVDYVDKETDLVMMTIGGNDYNFNDIIKECFVFFNKTTCEREVTSARQSANSNYKTNITKILDEIYKRGSVNKTRVVLLGYPLLSLDMSFTIGYPPYNIAQEIRRIGKEFNELQKQAIGEYQTHHPQRNVHFIETIPYVFAGYEPHPAPVIFNPINAINEIFQPGINIYEWYHPTELGHAMYATRLVNKFSVDKVARELPPPPPPRISFHVNRRTLEKVTEKIVDPNTGQKTKTPTPEAQKAIQDVAKSITNVVSNVNKVVRGFFSSLFSTNSANNDGRSAFRRSPIEQENFKISELGSISEYPSESKIAELLENLDLDEIEWHDSSGVEEEYHETKSIIVDLSLDATPEEQEKTIARLNYLIAKTGDGEQYALTSNDDEIKIKKQGSDKTISNLDELNLDILTEHLGDIKPKISLMDIPMTKLGDEVALSASGFSLFDRYLTYEWDLNGDGITDELTYDGELSFTPEQEFDGQVSVSITDSLGQRATDSKSLLVSRDGDKIPDELDNCPDVANMSQIDWDEDGIGDACDPEPGYPTNETRTEVDNCKFSRYFSSEICEQELQDGWADPDYTPENPEDGGGENEQENPGSENETENPGNNQNTEENETKNPEKPEENNQTNPPQTGPENNQNNPKTPDNNSSPNQTPPIVNILNSTGKVVAQSVTPNRTLAFGLYNPIQTNSDNEDEPEAVVIKTEEAKIEDRETNKTSAPTKQTNEQASEKSGTNFTIIIAIASSITLAFLGFRHLLKIK